jgi:hypothetical protein
MEPVLSPSTPKEYLDRRSAESRDAMFGADDGELVDYDERPAETRNENNKRMRSDESTARYDRRYNNNAGGGPRRPDDRDHSRYHFKNFCKMRKNAADMFELAMRIRNDARAGRTEDRTMTNLVNMAAAYCTCADCGKLWPQVTNESFVAPCGHVLCKPVCFNRNRRQCPLCPIQSR